MIFEDIERIEDVDLNRHALIEASAGTGKTHTLSHLVIRLLKEHPDLDIGNILLVTFTEKAAGELKERVRQLISATAEEPVQDDPVAAQRFNTMLADFDDEAAIYTIHGFCHRLLKDYAFENRALFNSEMVADPPLVGPLLKREMREQWPRRHGYHLPEMMRLAGYSRSRGGLEARISVILQKTPRPDLGDRLLPPIDNDYSELREQLMGAAQQLDTLLNGSPSFADQYEQLNIGKNSKQANIKNILDPLAHWVQSPDPPDLATIVQYKKSKEMGANALTPKWLKDGDNSAAVCPGLLQVKELFHSLLTLYEKMTHYLVLTSIEPLKQRIQAAKAREGLISYDDMIESVHRALFGSTGALFADAIRRQFQVALVDEFQDTDPLQWRIFRELFLRGPTQRIFLIGDPKQAIYGFRGADLYTYLAAKKELAHLAQKGRAALYTLSTNYRSSRPLIGAYNDLFSQPKWYGDDRQAVGTITYGKVRHPSGGTPADQSDAALHLIDLSSVERPALAYAPLAEFIAQEVGNLVSRQPFAIHEKEGEASRSIQWSDIAILIRRKNGPETVLLERALSARAIPFSYYKKPGLFQSNEAYVLSVVLQAVATPHPGGIVRRALLTPFFDLTLSEVVEPRYNHTVEKARIHLINWGVLAQKRRWGAFFDALLITSGFTFRAAQKPFWERQITNYRQLFELLIKEAMNSNLDLDGLRTWFEQKRTGSSRSGTEEEVHRIETELPKVQIMTIHAAKGLEFPVVFVAGGLTKGGTTTINTYHQMEGLESRQVIDLTGKVNLIQVEKEQLDEEKNLYYVAMTRARQRLYFPFMKGKKMAGPVGGFIATAIYNAFGNGGGPVEWRNLGEIHKTNPLWEPNDNPVKIPKRASLPQPLFAEKRTYADRVTRLASFSSLQQKASARKASRQRFWWDLSQKEDDEPAHFEPSPMVADELPGGKAMGSCFHLILEKIDYTDVAKDQARLAPGTPSGAVVDQAIAAFGIDPQWRRAVCEIVQATLTAPIKMGVSQITLGALPPKDRLHEAEFMFTLAERKTLAQTRGLRGAIDLVFRQRNRYYVVDFKSNKLTDYGPEALEKSITKDGYQRQYRIYAASIHRWLAQLRPGRDEPLKFGGVFYLYLRGLTQKGSTGIYFVPSEEVGHPEKIEQQIWPWFNREPFSDA